MTLAHEDPSLCGLSSALEGNWDKLCSHDMELEYGMGEGNFTAESKKEKPDDAGAGANRLVMGFSW